MKTLSMQRVTDLNDFTNERNKNNLISMPADGDTGIITEALLTPVFKTQDPLEMRLGELQAGITNIMFHLRAISRRR